MWGEDVILDSDWLMGKYCARAMTFLEVYTISRTQLMEAASFFPETALHIRRCAVRLAVRREFIRIAKLAREEDIAPARGGSVGARPRETPG